MISVITPALVKDGLGYQWLHETIASVSTQPGDWEHIIVNDHSPVKLDALKRAWPHVRWLDAEGKGVSAARNQAVDHARGDLILPLDADDKLASGALDEFRKGWVNRGSAGIIYSDVVMFGEDYARVYLAAEYDFPTLLKATFMTVGCLHRKADWDQIGGWRLDMTQGLEDWEYWIAMGEAGICGKRVPAPLYWYRRHPRGRLQWLKSNIELWDRAYLAMRELHIDSFNGRYPMGCCGGRSKTTRVPAKAPVAPAAKVAATAATSSDGDVLLAYYGARAGDFRVVSGVTRTKYYIPGRGGIVEFEGVRRQGVKKPDVPWFLAVNGGRDFRVVDAQSPSSPIAAVAKPAPEPVVETDPADWEPDIMEPEPPPVLDIQEMTVSEIRGMEFPPDMAQALIGQEEAGKERKTVLEFLRGLVDGGS